jgi:hypothetical protein
MIRSKYNPNLIMTLLNKIMQGLNLKKTSKQPLLPIKIRKGNVLSIARSAYKDKGLYYFIRTVPKYLLEVCIKSSETFDFQGNTYHYLFHTYCTTWKNERAAIIPIAWEIVKKYQEQNKKILEIGNVMSYYYHVNHDILDKYEIVDRVINEDVVDFNPSKLYDLIISLFTLQGVGLDESPREPAKILRAIENLKKILASDGQIIVIHVLGAHKEVDELLKNGILKFSSQFYLKRISDYKWKEAKWNDVKDLGYVHSIPTANGVVMGVIKNDIAANITTNRDRKII